MFNHRSANENSLTAPLPAPRFIAWWVWSFAGLVGVVGVLWWAGSARPAWPAAGFVGFVSQICGGLGAMFRADDKNGVSIGARLAFFLVVLLLLYFFWRATRAWLAYKPGPVDVQQLEDATPPGTNKPSNVDLTAKLRQRLSESSMYPPSTLPAQAPAESFLELLGDIQIDPNKIGMALPKILSRLRPKLAYRVSGVLQYRNAEPDQYGMTVTVTAFLFGGSRAFSVWGSDWDDVIRKAGIWTLSTLLPVTRMGRFPPWRQWWGRELKPELYQAYQEATELVRSGRHHEALEKYFKAIRLDPKNPYLRAELAETQEKLGMHIDALSTYQRALTLDGQTTRRYQKRIWQSRWSLTWRRLRYLRHPRRFHELLGIRYRNSIILGTRITAKHWYERSGANDERTHDELMSTLVERYWPTLIKTKITGWAISKRKRLEAKNSLREILNKRSAVAYDYAYRSREENDIRLVFQRASTQEMNRLSADDAWARVWLYWPASLWSLMRAVYPAAYLQTFHGSQQLITRRTFRINRRVLAPLRLAWVSLERNANESPYEWMRRYAWRPTAKISWSRMKASSLNHRLIWARMGWPSPRGNWLHEYNAACAYVIAMNAPSADDKFYDELANRAIEHLEKAVLAPRRIFATVERAWMAEEDPDLEPLRQYGAYFNNFIETVYPNAEGFEQGSIHDMPTEQLRGYDYRLLEETARVMQSVWRQRSEGVVDIHSAIEWLRVECEIWESIHEIADADRMWKWQDRVDLISRIQAHCRPFSYSSPNFPPPMLLNGEIPRNGLTLPLIQERLRALELDVAPDVTPDASHINDILDTPHSNSQESQWVLRAAAADGVARLEMWSVRKLCTGYAAAWQTLGDWLAEKVSEQPFRLALGKVPQFTRRAIRENEAERKIQV
ncbi:tetratricopeptide repeat protein [Streptomyces coeruleorubidus]|uniref:tetratricopeptide repeat protein n=1 Tax=Streptomyces coeruleorubidus TaxID=116188 RepID=UPI003797A23C